jgi:hypothetical protein
MGRFEDIPPAGEDPREDELAERGRGLVATAVGQTYAPPALRERIQTERERTRRAQRWRARGLAGSLAAAVAAVVVALVVSLNGAGAAPTVPAIVELAEGGPTLPAPARDARNPNILDTRIEGLPFPEWDADFRWPAVGERRDEIDGRNAATVFYDSPRGARAAYTILGGDAIEPPDGARTVHANDQELWLLRRGDQRIVVWNRDGHTCVMSAPAAVPEKRLVELAAWDAGGDVPF